MLERMRKALLVAAGLVGIGVLVRRAVVALPKVDWERRFESLPDNAPPKWMFRNISAIRENTERIIELLERDRRGGVDTPVDSPVDSQAAGSAP